MAISADRPSELKDSIGRHDLGFQLLSDSTMTAAAQFGLAWRAPPNLVQEYLAWDIDLEAASGQSHHILPVPAVFIVGTDGVVRFQYVNPNHRVRISADVLLSAAETHMARMSQPESPD